MEDLGALKNAIKSGDLVEIKKLLLKVSLTRNDVSEAFFESIRENQSTIFKYFVDEVDGLNLRYSDSAGKRALHYAVETGNLGMVKELLKHGASISYSDHEGYQAIHIATQNGHTEMLTFLIHHGANVSSAKTLKDGLTPVHIAALYNQPQALQILSERVSSLNTPTKRHNNCLSPLHLAVKSDHVDIVKLLCEKKACLDLSDTEGRTPLHYAADKGNLSILKILLDNGSSLLIKDVSRRSVLQYAVFSKSVECVQLLIEKGANVNEADLSGHTPLVAAVTVGSADIVDILLKRGAEVNIREPGHETPLLLAASAGNYNVIKRLVEAGANIKAKNRFQETVLHKCQKIPYEKRDEIVKLLIDAGAELCCVDSRGFTALNNAAFQTVFNNFTISTLKLLVEAGALVSNYASSGSNGSRNSPLCWFVWRGYFEAATYLVNSGMPLYQESWMYLPGKSPEQDDFHEWMRDISRNPPSLIQACRSTIRYHLLHKCTGGREIVTSLAKLQIPRTIKEFLMLKT